VTERWPADLSRIGEAAERLKRGAVVAFPTDTLYAVGARAGDAAAVRRLYAVKQRPAAQPMVWLVMGRGQVEGEAIVSAGADELMRRFWPGPLTLVLPARRGVRGATIAVRAPDHEVALALLAALGEPIASSSANPAGQPPPVDADQVIAGLGDRLDLVLDGGPCRIGQPSTILDLSGAAPRILRQGAIPASALISPSTSPSPSGGGQGGAS
jgi:L-threonylcarbamoyladenylate synthase